MSLRSIKECIIKNTKDYFSNKKPCCYDFTELRTFNYPKMYFTGSERDILDFSKLSMFYHNDPIEATIKYSKKMNCKSLNDVEQRLLEALVNLKEAEKEEKQIIRLSEFSGLSVAREDDWGTLENFANHLSRHKFYENKEPAEVFSTLMEEIFKSGKINTAIYHSWSKRYYFINHDGSHRLAMLWKLDNILNKKTEIEIKVQEWMLDINYMKNIFENYIGIITTGRTYWFLASQLTKNNVKILLQEEYPIEGNNYVLWIEKTQDKNTTDMVKFINELPSDRCYLISNALKNYL